jgi:ferredoxin-NADP reductase
VPESPERSAHSLKLTGRSEVAERTVEFRFEKPQSFDFKAGQFMDLTLVDPPETDGEGNTRAFSINSAPDDPDLVFATRLRDTAFKRVLQSMPLGTVVEGYGPFGNLTLHNDTRRPVVLLAGGIGITPFLEEFRALERRNLRFTFVPTM